MTIESDRWIRRMAEKHRMIEPFVPGQVKHAHGHKLVSYGTSSYGYDIRCSDEFKIFTNINSTIVDAKAFDDVCETSYRGPGRQVPGSGRCHPAEDLMLPCGSTSPFIRSS